jgi:hypothetical protein
MALAGTLQLSFFALHQATAIPDRFSGAAGGRSIHDLQFQLSLSGSTSRTQARPEIGIRDLGSLDGSGMLKRTQSSNPVRGLGGYEDQRSALQYPNDSIDLMDAAASVLRAIIVSRADCSHWIGPGGFGVTS